MNNSHTRQEKFEAIVSRFAEAQNVGITALVGQHGDVIYRAARGKADIALDRPMTAEHVMRVGSLTKQMTSGAIMLLHERGKLSITDDIRKYLPSFPTEHPITVEQLMCHTAGLGNHTDNPELMTRIKAPITPDEFVTLCAATPKHNTPNEAMRYSNDGYVLLGKIIEVVSGQPYAAFMAEHIFEPLGMINTEVGEARDIPHRAKGYTRGQAGVEDAFVIDMSWPYAGGSIVSTVDNLFKWMYALRGGGLISAENFQSMITRPTLNSGRKSDYGYGFGITKIYRHRSIQHGGGIPGFNAFAIYFPDEDLYVVALSNSDTANMFMVCAYLAAEVLDIPMPTFKPVAVAPEILETWAGKYQFEHERIGELVVNGESLTYQRPDSFPQKIVPLSEQSFYFDGSISYAAFETKSDGTRLLKIFPLLVEEPEVGIRLA